MTLREIAEFVVHISKKGNAENRIAKVLTILLDTVVEERANLIFENRKWNEGTQYSKGQVVNIPDKESCRTQALRELDLGKVWPLKQPERWACCGNERQEIHGDYCPKCG